MPIAEIKIRVISHADMHPHCIRIVAETTDAFRHCTEWPPSPSPYGVGRFADTKDPLALPRFLEDFAKHLAAQTA